jgi:hypothetical protein
MEWCRIALTLTIFAFIQKISDVTLEASQKNFAEGEGRAMHQFKRDP